MVAASTTHQETTIAPPLEEGCIEEALASGHKILAQLRQCVELSGEPCEGNLLHTWNSWRLEPEMDAKRKNIFALSRYLKYQGREGGDGGPQILEIGFNAGHSVCLMLLANPKARVVAFDLCEHRYTQPCARALQEYFGKDRLELYAGPSTETLPAYRKDHPDMAFDLLHVDGGHQYHVGLSDMENCWHLARLPPYEPSIVVLDDIDLTGVGTVWADCIAAGRVLQKIPPHPLGKFQHGIGILLRDDATEGPGTCAACGTRDAPRCCGGCRDIRYCSEPCARSHWKKHKSVCSSRMPSPLVFPKLEELVPSQLLQAGPEGSLLAAQNLHPGDVLFCEGPLSWQPETEARSKLCANCGMMSSKHQPCAGCGQVVFCTDCEPCARCHMCPELKITQGHVGPFTLVVLDVLRRREMRKLSHDALPPPSVINNDHRRASASVQRVGHFCSAVKWSDERAAEVFAAMIPGRVAISGNAASSQGLAVGFYPKFARLRAAASGKTDATGNVRVQIRPGPDHRFSVHAVVSTDVPKGSALHLPS